MAPSEVTLPLIATVAVPIIGCAGTMLHCISDSACSLKRKPLYCLAFFQKNVGAEKWAAFNERRLEDNLDKLNWEYRDLKKVLIGLPARCWQKTVADCIVNDLDGYDAIDSDQYEVHWDVEANCARREPQRGTVSLSLKIAIISDSVGVLSGVVTFHTSG